MKYFILSILVLISIGANSQDKKKARLSLQYVDVMNAEVYISLSAKYKGENGFEPVAGVEFHFYKKLTEDSLSHLGTANTNESGKAKFILNEKQDSSDPKTFVVKLENDSTFSDTESELTVLKATLSAKIETLDSVNRLLATLTDGNGQPLAGQSLKVQLQRMYAPLTIGEDSYETDESGTIQVPIEDKMPGIDGNLTFEVVLNESEDYETIKALVKAPIGIPITDQSTFDKRTMWSPPTKTPYYLLIFPNLIILGVWIPIFFLLINLFRIFNTKQNEL